MKNLFKTLKELLFTSFNFTSEINKVVQSPSFCPECGKLIITQEDVDAFKCIGICEDCYIRISDESLAMCEKDYYDYYDDFDDTSDTEYYSEAFDVEYCEADDLVYCPTCGKEMSKSSSQWMNIGECETCYFG